MLRRSFRKKIILCLFAFVFSLLFSDWLYFRERIYPGVFLNHIHLGSKSWQEAENILQEYTLELLLPDGRLVPVRLDRLGVNLDIAAILDRAYRCGRNRSLPFSYLERLQLHLHKEQLQPVYLLDEDKMQACLSELCSRLAEPPRDAVITIEQGKAVIIPEKAGYSLQETAVREIILQHLGAGSKTPVVALPTSPIEPELTVKILEEKQIRSLRGIFTTSFNAPQLERSHNIRLAAGILNNYFIENGEVFSVNAIVGDTTPEKGYKKAPVIMGAELVPGYGGGLCQVSTTLYNAALLAGLEIVERHPHGMVIPYVAPGRDATIAYPDKDLKIRNTTGGTVLITAETTANDLTFAVFGLPGAYEITVETEILQVIMPPTRIRTDPSLPPGEERLVEGEPGYVVETRRKFLENGITVKTEILSVDSYSPYPTVISQGKH